MKRFFAGLFHAALTGSLGAVVGANLPGAQMKDIGIVAGVGALSGVYGWLQKRPQDFWNGAIERRIKR